MKKIFILTIASLAVLFFQSCEKNYFDVYTADELGAVQKTYEVAAGGEDVHIPFLSNQEGTIRLMNSEDESWVWLESTAFKSDGTLTVHVLPNDGFRRRAGIVFTTETRRDSVTLLQNGIKEDIFEAHTTSKVVLNGTTEANSIPVTVKVPLDMVDTQVIYPGDEDWIFDCQLSENALTFKTTDNTDELHMRRANIILSFTDGWDRSRTLNISVAQTRADNSLGTVYSPQELMDVATARGYVLPDDAVMEGYIVSTTEGGNAGDAVVSDYKQGTGVVDYTLTDCTSYIESVDGKYGFRLIASSEADNDFQRYSRVTLGIGGAVIKKSASEPYHYTIEGIYSSNLLNCSEGYDTMPWKEKSITELTDDDINTLVTIKDCEIAMRKGPFTPINEGYSSACGYNRIAKFPILIRDRQGGSMYMFTNISCNYRRNGETLPYGSGKITGIIVHEDYFSFEKNGYIGRYQIRHLLREEIDLKPSFEDNDVSGLITEFRYLKTTSGSTHLPNAIIATKGNGEMCHTSGNKIENYDKTYFYIGKSGSNRKKKYEEGAGIELDKGRIYEPWKGGNEYRQNEDGKGWFTADMNLSWSCKNWWEDGRGKGWLVRFSTVGIVSDRVSMQFAMYNNSQSLHSPRYWKAQYSLTTSDTSADYDDQWTDIGEFTVPDVAIWDYQNDWQTLGPRVYDFPLPTEILGKSNVYIRLVPVNNKAAEKDVESYDNSTISSSGYNTMDYFAVRYNK